MPTISDFRCNKCKFSLPSGWGGYTYVQDDNGERIICPHPAESQTIAEVLGLKENEIFPPGNEEIRMLLKERTGFASNCLCLNCLKTFELDLAKHERRCPECDSYNVRAALEMIGQKCPKCNWGYIAEIETSVIS